MFQRNRSKNIKIKEIFQKHLNFNLPYFLLAMIISNIQIFSLIVITTGIMCAPPPHHPLKKNPKTTTLNCSNPV